MQSAVAAIAAIRNHSISATELTELYIAKIQSRNPTISAICEVLEEQARRYARELDDRIANSKPIGALAGLPVVVKENCDTAGATCSAGLSFRQNNRPTADSDITRRMRQTDAIILGVSASDPGAFSTRTPDVTHPVDSNLTVGGSSGGSAAALVSGMCLGAIGTDTGGSIRIPSACCGTVGLKPTFGALPMDGIFPLVKSLDHVGPMANTVSDTQLLWNALTEKQVGQQTLATKRVGFDPKWLSEARSNVQHAVSRVLKKIELSGIELVEIQLPNLDEISSTHGTIFIVEALQFHTEEYGEYREHYPEIAQNWFDLAESTSRTDYDLAVIKRAMYSKLIDHLLDDVDFIVGPTLFVSEIDKHANAIRIADQDLDFTMAMVRATALFNHTGHPALVQPLYTGLGELPSSLQVVGKKGEETKLLQFGQWCERIAI